MNSRLFQHINLTYIEEQRGDDALKFNQILSSVVESAATHLGVTEEQVVTGWIQYREYFAKAFVEGWITKEDLALRSASEVRFEDEVKMEEDEGTFMYFYPCIIIDEQRALEVKLEEDMDEGTLAYFYSCIIDELHAFEVKLEENSDEGTLVYFYSCIVY